MDITALWTTVPGIASLCLLVVALIAWVIGVKTGMNLVITIVAIAVTVCALLAIVTATGYADIPIISDYFGQDGILGAKDAVEA